MRTHHQPERKIRTAREYPLAGWLFTAPATLGFLLFTVGPMLISLYYSFTSFDGITPAHLRRTGQLPSSL